VTSILLIQCGDRAGIVAGVSGWIHEGGGNILDADQHTDPDTGEFFMRVEFEPGPGTDRLVMKGSLDSLSARLGLTCTLHEGGAAASAAPRVAIFAGPTPHCLYDLLLTQRLGELPGTIALVVSNHESVGVVARHFEVPFHHIPVMPTAEGKMAAEAQQRALLKSEGIDLMVLARYMQILSPEFTTEWEGRGINIHHSFLPAFAGARPYHQAKARGVKLIGATAHYVTQDLDEGPIIAQATAPVTHRDAVEDLVRKGRDLERSVLTRAVRLHLQRRVLITGNRTVVFGE
jgi:formyltetrahydrofolate deformylase